LVLSQVEIVEQVQAPKSGWSTSTFGVHLIHPGGTSLSSFSSFCQRKVKELANIRTRHAGLDNRVQELAKMTGPKSTMGMLKEIESGTAAEVGLTPPPVLAVTKLTK
jgi:hypothetical protein